MKRVNIKSTIEYVVNLLRSLGVTNLTAETLRKGKFNDPGVASILWRALHDIIILSLAQFPENPGSRLVELWKRLEEEGHSEGCSVNVELVKHYLDTWGYVDPPFFKLTPGNDDSRTLLIALGWTISRCKVFECGLDHLHRKLPMAELLPPYPEVYWRVVLPSTLS
ncbi:hypothetical protein CYMTET_26667 [Cymbomonas tetramitiformis]|uniref:Uncharacterized protein n=1 Tax=Cymbomonas tetramitiformis TaxID=36881 RepID=A0AAE0FRK8_9CHLO|nr:hypothetical protein CYMTET_26667 [Cymbomonas tetramitiformis]